MTQCGAAKVLQGIANGKRLTYRRINGALRAAPNGDGLLIRCDMR